jgi:hypothetical protein
LLDPDRWPKLDASPQDFSVAKSAKASRLPRALPPHRISGLQNPPPAKHAESLSGPMERLTFFNEETGYAEPKVKANGRDHVIVVGSLPTPGSG